MVRAGSRVAVDTMTDEKNYNVLFLCPGNSARSILAEATLNRSGRGRFRAYSAGSQPKGDAHPFALDLLQKLNYPTDGLRSKSWDAFAIDTAPNYPQTGSAVTELKQT